MSCRLLHLYHPLKCLVRGTDGRIRCVIIIWVMCGLAHLCNVLAERIYTLEGLNDAHVYTLEGLNDAHVYTLEGLNDAHVYTLEGLNDAHVY
jgi:hypothetical protein